MTVYIEKPAVNLREELASLRNQGGYEERQFWFENAVTNGTFDTGTTRWTAFNGATISVASGKLRVTNGASGRGGAGQSVPTVAGRVYRVTLDGITSPNSTNVFVYVGLELGNGSIANLVNVNGTGLQLTFVAQGSGTWITVLPADTLAGDYNDFDNVSVFETDGTNVVHRMPKGWVPKDVFEDGLLQREGAANDYTVVYDGFDYYVKPAVAPSATTQTCVIGVRK